MCTPTHPVRQEAERKSQPSAGGPPPAAWLWSQVGPARCVALALVLHSLEASCPPPSLEAAQTMGAPPHPPPGHAGVCVPRAAVVSWREQVPGEPPSGTPALPGCPTPAPAVTLREQPNTLTTTASQGRFSSYRTTCCTLQNVLHWEVTLYKKGRMRCLRLQRVTSTVGPWATRSCSGVLRRANSWI